MQLWSTFGVSVLFRVSSSIEAAGINGRLKSRFQLRQSRVLWASKAASDKWKRKLFLFCFVSWRGLDSKAPRLHSIHLHAVHSKLMPREDGGSTSRASNIYDQLVTGGFVLSCSFHGFLLFVSLASLFGRRDGVHPCVLWLPCSKPRAANVMCGVLQATKVGLLIDKRS